MVSSSLPLPSTAWTAVVRRDARFDGRFVYAVTSTGVFCRPSCPSRRPGRERVRFYRDAASAITAGFRACRRCHPGRDVGVALPSVVTRALAHLQHHPDRPVTLAELAREAACSPYHLQRTFKRAIGLSPREYQDAVRRHRFITRLRAGDTVSRAGFEAGYGSSSRIYGRRDIRGALPPGAHRRRGAGLRIRFATVGVPLGRLLVAFTERGVCAVQLGDDDAEVERAFRAAFSAAEITRASRKDSAWVDGVAQLARGQAGMTVPLDVQGTVFEWKVWKALQRIPSGQTRSYAEVARLIGAPTGARAVAMACAHNPAALVVPCHRVVRSDGSLGGYHWGKDRKARLLEQERSRGEGEGRH